MAHLFVKDIQPGQQIQDIYMVTQPVLRNTAKGDLYIAMYLSDKTGRVNSRMWQASEEIYQSIPSEGFVLIRGKSELYQGSMQLVVNEVRTVEPDQVRITDYVPRTEKNIGEMYEQTKSILATIQNPDLKRLTRAFLDDAELMKQFCIAPGGMRIHHAYIGGLLEHTLNMLNAAVALFSLYPKIQKDLVLAAIFLHDIAKTQELSYKVSFSYTDRGQLLGHIVLGAQMISQKADDLRLDGEPVDADILNSLLHIIVSHHGEYEFGSPKIPASPEAFMVYYIDDLDSTLNQVVNLIENDVESAAWTQWNNALGTKLYRKRATEQNTKY